MNWLHKFNLKSIQIKITLWAGLCLFLAAAVIIAYSAIELRNAAIDAAKDEALAIAKYESREIKAEIEVALDAARTLAQALSAVQDPQNPALLSRDQVNAMLRQVTANNPQFIGTFTLWEPNAFDGQDALYAGQAPYDHTGRFIAYWNRNEQGNIQVETPVDYEITGPGDYYQLPKRTRQECITEPYVYPVQGKEVLMTSVVVPIIVDGQFYGIAGIDIGLEFLQELADGAHIFGGAGELVLISNAGTLAGVTGRPDLVGQSAQAVHTDFEKDLPSIQEGQEIIETMDDEMEIFVPIEFGQTQTPWSVNLLLPYSEITAQATASMWRLVGIGVALAGAALILLWFMAGQIAKPIKETTHVAQAVSAGNLDVKAQVTSKDETGVLADAFNHMVEQLRAMLRKEKQQRQYIEAFVDTYVDFVTGVAQGNLNERLDMDGDKWQDERTDEPLVVLGHNLNSMADNLRDMTMQTKESASQLSSAAAEIMAATTQQASSASEQSAAITQTTTTVDEVKTIAEQSVVRAQEVADSSQRTVEVSRAGQQAVQETIASMAQIKTRVEGIAENILALSEQTQQIGEIIATVNDIAAQSNMLALNASVEAARAGEHGKGFAVVAVEVRNLAEQSRQATAQIKAILSDIQRATNATVMATEEGTKGVDEGVQLAAQTKAAIQQLSGAIDESAQVAMQVVAGGQQQASGVEQVALAMQNINQATTQSLASTRQAEQAAQDLNELARSLIETVEHYEL